MARRMSNSKVWVRDSGTLTLGGAALVARAPLFTDAQDTLTGRAALARLLVTFNWTVTSGSLSFTGFVWTVTMGLIAQDQLMGTNLNPAGAASRDRSWWWLSDMVFGAGSTLPLGVLSDVYASAWPGCWKWDYQPQARNGRLVTKDAELVLMLGTNLALPAGGQLNAHWTSSALYILP